MPKGYKRVITPGDKFGRLTIINELPKKDKSRYFYCECECGNKREVKIYSLTSGITKSCGCLNREISSKANQTHGMYEKRIYKIWRGMRGRCQTTTNGAYGNYGGRGIKVCDEWQRFENFYNWAMENGYEEHLTIERIDVNGNYEPSNCKWETMDVQRRNTTKVKFLEFNGEKLTMRQWAIKMDMGIATLCNRLKEGWSIEKALTTPTKKKGKAK